MRVVGLREEKPHTVHLARAVGLHLSGRAWPRLQAKPAGFVINSAGVVFYVQVLRPGLGGVTTV